MNAPAKVALVGTGWRAGFFARLARSLPDQFTLVGAAVRRAAAVETVGREWGVPAYLSPTELVAHQHPDFVICSVSADANQVVVSELVQAGARVLAETPPAPDVVGLQRLWAQAGAAQQVQVAEQYLLMPGHAARREVVRRGAIGEVSSVQVSSTHGYHAVAIVRGLLEVGFGAAAVQARRFTGPLVDPLNRAGWTDDPTPKPAATTIATIDFGDGRSGLYDFTDNQWHNPLRLRRILIRGSLGELADDTVKRLSGPRTVTTSALVRSQLGYDLNLDGYDTEHISFDGEVVYRNPYIGLRLMDEEIAIASIMTATARWTRDEGPAPYPLAQACQDQLVALAIEDSLRTGAEVRTAVEAWASTGG